MILAEKVQKLILSTIYLTKPLFFSRGVVIGNVFKVYFNILKVYFVQYQRFCVKAPLCYVHLNFDSIHGEVFNF